MKNAFQMARPRGADTAPAKAPRKTNHSRAPMEGNVHEVLALDRNGRRTVSLALWVDAYDKAEVAK